MFCHVRGPFGQRSVRSTRGCQHSYRPTLEILEERALLTGTAFAGGPMLRQVNAAADQLLQMTAHLVPQMQGRCGTDQFLVMQIANMVGQVRNGAVAAKASFRHAGHSGKNAATVLGLEKQLIADLGGGTGGLGRLANDASNLERQCGVAMPPSIAYSA